MYYTLFPNFYPNLLPGFQFLECIYKKSGRQFGSRLPAGFSRPTRFSKPDTFEFNMVKFNGDFHLHVLEWSIVFIWSYR